MASWTGRRASRPPFQAITTLSPTGPGFHSGGSISIGALDSSCARSRAPRRTTLRARLSGRGAIIKSTQWVKLSDSPGLSAGTKTVVRPDGRVVSLNARLTSAPVSASRPAEGALTSTPINRAPCALANATAKRIRSTLSTVGSR
jgi:hypothetical protein